MNLNLKNQPLEDVLKYISSGDWWFDWYLENYQIPYSCANNYIFHTLKTRKLDRNRHRYIISKLDARINCFDDRFPHYGIHPEPAFTESDFQLFYKIREYNSEYEERNDCNRFDIIYGSHTYIPESYEFLKNGIDTLYIPYADIKSEKWELSNIKNYPYLQYDIDGNPVRRLK